MTLDVVDINGYVRPRGINATVTYRHNAGPRQLAACAPWSTLKPASGTLRQFIMYAGHHQHRYLRYYSDSRYNV